MGSSSSRFLATKQPQKNIINSTIGGKNKIKNGIVPATNKRKIGLFERFSNAYEIWSIRRKNAELEKEIQNVQKLKKKLIEKHDQDSMLIRKEYENRKLAALHSVKMNAKESAVPSIPQNQSAGSAVSTSPRYMAAKEVRTVPKTSKDDDAKTKNETFVSILKSGALGDNHTQSNTTKLVREEKGENEQNNIESTKSSIDLLAYLQKNESRMFRSNTDANVVDGKSKDLDTAMVDNKKRGEESKPK